MADQGSSVSIFGQRRFGIIAGLVVVVLIAVGGWLWLTAGRESTDDAQVEAHVTPIAARVPGSVLRGALASVWIGEHGIPDAANRRREEFIALFERDVRYGPLFQDGTAVVPLSAIWCKYPATDACREWSADAADESRYGVSHASNAVCRRRRRRAWSGRIDRRGFRPFLIAGPSGRE